MPEAAAGQTERHRFKVVCLGDCQVGKSDLIASLLRHEPCHRWCCAVRAVERWRCWCCCGCCRAANHAALVLFNSQNDELSSPNMSHASYKPTVGAELHVAELELLKGQARVTLQVQAGGARVSWRCLCCWHCAHHRQRLTLLLPPHTKRSHLVRARSCGTSAVRWAAWRWRPHTWQTRMPSCLSMISHSPRCARSVCSCSNRSVWGTGTTAPASDTCKRAVSERWLLPRPSLNCCPTNHQLTDAGVCDKLAGRDCCYV